MSYRKIEWDYRHLVVGNYQTISNQRQVSSKLCLNEKRVDQWIELPEWRKQIIGNLIIAQPVHCGLVNKNNCICKFENLGRA